MCHTPKVICMSFPNDDAYEGKTPKTLCFKTPQDAQNEMRRREASLFSLSLSLVLETGRTLKRKRISLRTNTYTPHLQMLNFTLYSFISTLTLHTVRERVIIQRDRERERESGVKSLQSFQSGQSFFHLKYTQRHIFRLKFVKYLTHSFTLYFHGWAYCISKCETKKLSLHTFRSSSSLLFLFSSLKKLHFTNRKQT